MHELQWLLKSSASERGATVTAQHQVTVRHSLPHLWVPIIGKHDMALEAHSIQDVEALADAEMLWDVRDEATAKDGRKKKIRML